MSNLAAILPSPKAPLITQDLPISTPAPNELLIKTSLIALNAIEYKHAKLAILPLPYPVILGSVFTGTIHQVGSHIANFKIGEKVVVLKRFGTQGNRYGAYQRYVVVGEGEMVCRVREGVDGEVVVSLMMNAVSVVGLLSGRLGFERASLEGTAPARGKKVLVYGGSSSFGGLSVQYLAKGGYEVVTTSSAKNRDFVSKLGAGVVVDHTLEKDKLIERLVAEGPYDVVVDTISTPDTVAVTGRVLAAQGGGKLYAMQPTFEPKMLPEGVERVFEPWPESLYEEKNRELQEWVVNTYLPQGVAGGAITPLSIETVRGGLEGINGALDRLQKGVSGVRLVVDPWE
jgi:NADPH:quinone reductase-like Zn-dependent oxidoreductase